MTVKIMSAGGFDPLHIGHLEHLRQARRLGDKLIVVVNPDSDIIAKRGVVFMPMGQRIELLKDLKYVDEVVVSIDGDGTIAKTILWLKPDILAKGGDRDATHMPENEILACEHIGCRIVYGVGDVLSSSTDLLKRIRSFKGDLTHNPSKDFL